MSCVEGAQIPTTTQHNKNQTTTTQSSKKKTHTGKVKGEHGKSDLSTGKTVHYNENKFEYEIKMIVSKWMNEMRSTGRATYKQNRPFNLYKLLCRHYYDKITQILMEFMNFIKLSCREWERIKRFVEMYIVHRCVCTLYIYIARQMSLLKDKEREIESEYLRALNQKHTKMGLKWREFCIIFQLPSTKCTKKTHTHTLSVILSYSYTYFGFQCETMQLM